MQVLKPSPELVFESVSFQRLYDEAPYKARCSSNKTASMIRPREYAIDWPYMQVNRTDMRSWLVFDLDHDNPFIWQDKNLPAPNLIVRNRASNSSHLYYAITPVCLSDKARRKPIEYMKAIYDAFVIELKADQAYNSGPIAKTPFHPQWITTELHSSTYELSELADHVELPYRSPWGRSPELSSVDHSRHCTLFELVRFYAYSIVSDFRDSRSFEEFRTNLENYAIEQNKRMRVLGFDSELRWSQVNSTVKSISRWTWDKYFGGGSANRGIMRLDKSIPLPKRQSMAAKRTHNVREQNNRKAILRACESLRRHHRKITYVNIATLTKLTRQTVAKYKEIVLKFKRLNLTKTPATIIPITELLKAQKNVNFAIYQISAPQKDLSGVAVLNRSYIRHWYLRFCNRSNSNIVDMNQGRSIKKE